MNIHNHEASLNLTHKLSGVGMIIEDIEGNILLVLENDSKAWKRSGQWSTPFGTSKKNELPLDTATREIKEEIGLDIPLDNIRKKGMIKAHILGNKILYDMDVTVFHIRIDTESLKKALKFQNYEIGKVCLAKLDYIKNRSQDNIRPGVIEALYSAKKSMDYPHIVKVQNGTYTESYLSTIKLIKETI